MAVRILAGYPQQVGAKIELVVDIDGPASYGNTSTFATSGQQINASDFGIGGFEYIECDGLSSDGANAVQVALGATVAGASTLQPAPTTSPGPCVTSAVLHWYTTASSATESTNATNLAGKYIRVRIRGV
jgi:hypothetical protein